MKNTYLRLFVAQTKLMTAEKMRLDRFCQYGEYLAYKIALPQDPLKNIEQSGEVQFVFAADLENKQYHFTTDNIDEESFTTFELHLSEYLNGLFQRKSDFEQRNEAFDALVKKIDAKLTTEEKQCLATHVDINALNLLRALGVIKE